MISERSLGRGIDRDDGASAEEDAELSRRREAAVGYLLDWRRERRERESEEFRILAVLDIFGIDSCPFEPKFVQDILSIAVDRMRVLGKPSVYLWKAYVEAQYQSGIFLLYKREFSEGTEYCLLHHSIKERTAAQAYIEETSAMRSERKRLEAELTTVKETFLGSFAVPVDEAGVPEMLDEEYDAVLERVTHEETRTFLRDCLENYKTYDSLKISGELIQLKLLYESEYIFTRKPFLIKGILPMLDEIFFRLHTRTQELTAAYYKQSELARAELDRELSIDELKAQIAVMKGMLREIRVN